MGNAKFSSFLGQDKRQWGARILRGVTLAAVFPLVVPTLAPAVVQAQSIIPANDGTGTQVQLQGNELIIQGGSLSGDAANLFHSFDRFNVAGNEIATFQSAQGIQNIIGRVLGGDASRIDGILQISNGTSQLLLINPAGIVSGTDSQITAPGGFTATTADRVGFGTASLDSLLTVSDYSSFNGSPTSFEMGNGSQGTILNEGTINVDTGQAIRLIGSQVVNTGQLNASSGEITLLSLGSGQSATLTADGLARQSSSTAAGSPDLSLSQIIGSEATNLEFTADGQVRLASGTATTAAETTEVVVIGILEVSGEQGQIRLVGDRVALLDPDINASGDTPALAGSITVEAGSISGGSLNAGNVDNQGLVSTAAPDVNLSASGDIAIEQLLGRNVTVTSDQGNISLALGDASEGSRTVRAQTVSLSAAEGRIDLDGGIQAGEVERAEPGTITIEAQKFQATNPFVNTALAETNQPLVRMSLWAYPANVPDTSNIDTPPDPLPEGAVDIRLGDGVIPTRFGSGETLISIRLEDNVFAIDDGIDDPVQPFNLGDRSGTEGGIGTALSRVPPNVNPLALNNEFVSFDSPTAAVAELLVDDGETVASAICPAVEDQDPSQPVLQALSTPEQPTELTPEDLGLPASEPVSQPDGEEVLRAAQEVDGEKLSCGRE